MRSLRVKTTLSLLSVMAVLTLISFSSGCTKQVMETAQDDHLPGGEIDMPWHPPHKPEQPHVLIDKSDLIVFGEVVKVFNEIDMGEIERNQVQDKPVGFRRWFGRQTGSIKLLRILKGPDEYSSKIINIVKEKSDFYLKVGRKQVFYLKMVDGQYSTVDIFGAARSLGSALVHLNNLKLERGELDKGGIIISVLSETAPLSGVEIHVLRAPLKAPVERGDQRWEEHFIKTLKTDQFGICEVELPSGKYTLLLELESNLYSYLRFVDRIDISMMSIGREYYRFFIMEERREWNWQLGFFDLDRIRGMHEKGPQ